MATLNTDLKTLEQRKVILIANSDVMRIILKTKLKFIVTIPLISIRYFPNKGDIIIYLNFRHTISVKSLHKDRNGLFIAKLK